MPSNEYLSLAKIISLLSLCLKHSAAFAARVSPVSLPWFLKWILSLSQLEFHLGQWPQWSHNADTLWSVCMCVCPQKNTAVRAHEPNSPISVPRETYSGHALLILLSVYFGQEKGNWEEEFKIFPLKMGPSSSSSFSFWTSSSFSTSILKRSLYSLIFSP